MAITKPHEMNFSDKKFSMIISGSPGIGKTTLALSAPKPLLIDFDDGISRVKAQHRADTIICQSYEQVLEDLRSPELANYETIIIDTGGSLITYIILGAKDVSPGYIQGDGSPTQKGWGYIKSEFKRFTDALKHELKKNVIYVFHTVEDKTKRGGQEVTVQRLLCDGGAKNLVWQPCDIGCYVYIQGNKRLAGFTPTEEYFAKGTHGVSGLVEIPSLGPADSNNFMSNLFTNMRQTIAEESQIYDADKTAYDEVMAEGRQIVADMKTIEDANIFPDMLEKLPHIWTSKKEISTLAREKIKELGFVWNKTRESWEAMAA